MENKDARFTVGHVTANLTSNIFNVFSFLCRYPFIGASPDALLDDCVVEVKCPWILRNTYPDDLDSLKSQQRSNFCCIKTDSGLQLKKNHPYFLQVQTQMFCTGMKKAKFVV